MQTWVALIRGINVGGNNIVPMKTLRDLLSNLGFGRVQTYIQSGNCVFVSGEADRSTLSNSIATAIDTEFGFRPAILVLPMSEFDAAIQANPYPQDEDQLKTVHLSFLAEPPGSVDVDSLDAIKRPSERYHITDRVFYLHAPEGIGRSKLAAQAEKILGVAATARNLRSAIKIADLAR